MKTNYTLWNGQAAMVEVSGEVAEYFKELEREGKSERRQARRKNVASLDALNEEFEFEVESDFSVDDEFYRKVVRKFMLQLNGKQQQLVRWRYYEGKTEFEIAQILKVSQPAVHQQFRAIHKILEKYLKNF
ncbi:MAG: hypothetical protein FWC02_03480 [Firmicutes bacterium]|nr:hypothetical protein [Bacillota bacterium]